MMNILILSNGAPNYHNFFNALAHEVKCDGGQVNFAVDCETSLDENKIIDQGFSFEVFSEFFAQHEINEYILDKYKKYNLNYALLSDYDRANVYKLWGVRNNNFYEKLKSALLCFFEKIISSKNIKAVVYENVSNSFAYFCWFVCKEQGVRYIGLTSSRLPGRFWITDDPLGESKIVDKTMQDILCGKIDVPEDVLVWCKEYISAIEKTVPDYMRFNNLENTNLFKKYVKFEKIIKIINALKHCYDDHYHSYQRGNPLWLSWQLFNRSLGRKLKIKKLRKFYQNPDERDDYLLYPLHFHPESSTSILSGAYLNEFEVIQNIAFNLPQGLKLYVKDHMSAFGYPSIAFYERIYGLPGVKIIPPDAPTKKIISSSKGVITLTSTVGYEALLLNKPVYLYGEVFYKNHKNVKIIKDPTKIYDILHSKYHKEIEVAKDEDYNLNFVAAYFMSTLPGTLNLMLGESSAGDLASKVYSELKKVCLLNP